MRLQVTHDTFYDYAPSVETAQHLAYLKPLHTRYQTLLSHTVTIDPLPAQLTQNVDVFGNVRTFFALEMAHETLRVVACSVVLTGLRELPLSALSWENTRDHFTYQAGRRLDRAAEFVYASAFCPHHADFADYARPSFQPGVGVLNGAIDLMRRIHTDFTYDSESTQINTPARDALAQRKGVCQDFAHIMIACLRALGLPARYVSGYLLTHPAPGTVKLQGCDASHAWVAIYIPDLPLGDRWCDLDPTNNRAGWHAPGEDYVTLGTGRDFADVSPIRGVIHGGASHTLTVAVTVEPLQDEHIPQSRLPLLPASAPWSAGDPLQSQFQAG